MKNINPNARWSIKADGTDIQTGLRESVHKEWSGDVDWGDNALQKCHNEYMAYLKFVQSICRKTQKALPPPQALREHFGQLLGSISGRFGKCGLQARAPAE